jgi:hypothetical protein
LISVMSARWSRLMAMFRRVAMTWGRRRCSRGSRLRRTRCRAPVHRFDARLAAGDAGQVRGLGALPVQAGDAVHDLLADQGAGDVVTVAAYPRLGGVRKADAISAGEPDGPLDDAAVTVVQFNVVGLVRACGLDRVVGCALQSGLVALDEHGLLTNDVIWERCRSVSWQRAFSMPSRLVASSRLASRRGQAVSWGCRAAEYMHSRLGNSPGRHRR